MQGPEEQAYHVDEENHPKDERGDPPSLFHGQWIHLGFSAIALPLLLYFVVFYSSPDEAGDPGSLPVEVWLFVVALAVPVMHCVYVWLCWRTELNWRTITRRWGGGAVERGFDVYFRLFFLQFGMRFASLLVLAVVDAGSWPALRDRMWLRAALAAPVAAVGLWAMYSVRAFWGATTRESFARAAGRDHFFPDAYRNTPLVAGGIFKYTSNGMYAFGLQLVWLFGIVAASRLALYAALFNVTHIWAHYLGTEKPDMEYIYGRTQERGISRFRGAPPPPVP